MAAPQQRSWGPCHHLPGEQGFVGLLLLPVWSIWHPDLPTGAAGCSLPTRSEGLGDPARVGQSLHVTCSNHPHPLDLLPPFNPDGSGLPKLFLIF